MRIVRMQPQARALKIEFDTGETIEIAGDAATAFGIYRGMELTGAQYEQLRSVQQTHAALAATRRFLGYRARSEREVRRKLAQKDFPAAAIERAVETLRAAGALEDGLFAQQYVHDALLKKPAGKLRLRAELRRKGVPDDAIEAALDAQYGDEEECAAALRLAQRRQRLDADKTGAERQFALRRYLQSRGFTREAIDKTVHALFQQHGR